MKPEREQSTFRIKSPQQKKMAVISKHQFEGDNGVIMLVMFRVTGVTSGTCVGYQWTVDKDSLKT